MPCDETSVALGSVVPHSIHARIQAMVTKEDIEGFLNRLSSDGASHTEVEPGLWVVKPSGELDFGVVVHYSPPVVILRVKVMTLPDQHRTRWPRSAAACSSSTRPISCTVRTASRTSRS